MKLLPLIVLLLCPVLTISKDDCPISWCGDDGPDIRFPFRLKGQQPLHCGYPGFELSCIKNITTVQLSSSGLFSVTDIDYRAETIFIYDPNDCLPKRLLNFSLSNTPFSPGTSFQWLYKLPVYDYFYPSPKLELVNCSLLNCSTTDHHFDEIGYKHVPCLSTKGHPVFAVPHYFSMTYSISCVMIKKIPFPSPYARRTLPPQYFSWLREDNFSISLHWNIPTCQDCEEREGHCRFKNGTSNETACFNLPPDRDFNPNPYLFTGLRVAAGDQVFGELEGRA